MTDSCGLLESVLAIDETKRACQRDVAGVSLQGNVNSFGHSVVTLQSGGLSLSYNSYRRHQNFHGLGGGWNLNGFNLWIETDPETGDWVFHDGYGSFERWKLDGLKSYYSNCYLTLSVRADQTKAITALNGANYSFSQDGKLTRQVGSAGLATTYEYCDSSGRLLRVHDSEGRKYFFEYGNRIDSQPISVREMCPINGPQTRFEYNANGRLSKLTSPAGEKHLFCYTTDQALWKVVDGRGQVTVDFRYLQSGPYAGQVCSELQSDLTLIQYAYGLNSSNLSNITVTQANLGSKKDTTTVLTYNQRHLMVSRQVQSGESWTYRYDDPRNPYLVTSIEAPNFGVTRNEYDHLGRLTCLTGPTGVKTVWTYAQESDLHPQSSKSIRQSSQAAIERLDRVAGTCPCSEHVSESGSKSTVSRWVRAKQTRFSSGSKRQLV